MAGLPPLSNAQREWKSAHHVFVNSQNFIHRKATVERFLRNYEVTDPTLPSFVQKKFIIDILRRLQVHNVRTELSKSELWRKVLQNLPDGNSARIDTDPNDVANDDIPRRGRGRPRKERAVVVDCDNGILTELVKRYQKASGIPDSTELNRVARKMLRKAEPLLATRLTNLALTSLQQRASSSSHSVPTATGKSTRKLPHAINKQEEEEFDNDSKQTEEEEEEDAKQETEEEEEDEEEEEAEGDNDVDVLNNEGQDAMAMARLKKREQVRAMSLQETQTREHFHAKPHHLTKTYISRKQTTNHEKADEEEEESDSEEDKENTKRKSKSKIPDDDFVSVFKRIQALGLDRSALTDLVGKSVTVFPPTEVYKVLVHNAEVMTGISRVPNIAAVMFAHVENIVNTMMGAKQIINGVMDMFKLLHVPQQDALKFIDLLPPFFSQALRPILKKQISRSIPLV